MIHKQFSTEQRDLIVESFLVVCEHDHTDLFTVRQDDWCSSLPVAEFAFNNQINQSTGTCPFFCNYGFHPNFGEFSRLDSGCSGADMAMQRLGEVWREIQKNIGEARGKHKLFVDKRRFVGPIFLVGDKVWLSTKNICLKIPSAKLGPRFIGPYEIMEVVNPVVFRLRLPPSLQIPNVFHKSLLSHLYHPLLGLHPLHLLSLWMCTLPAEVVIGEVTENIPVLVDSGARVNLVDAHFVQTHGLMSRTLAKPVSVQAIDSAPLSQGSITQVVDNIHLRIGACHEEYLSCYVLEGIPTPMVLGLPWLKRHNLVIDWQSREVVCWGQSFKDCCPGATISVVLLKPTPSPSVGAAEVLPGTRGKTLPSLQVYPELIHQLNENTFNIRLTVNHHPNEIEFLDVILKRGVNGNICTSIYRKPTATNVLLHATSAHPQHMIRSVGQFLHLRRICSTQMIFEQEAEKLKTRFREHGYSNRAIKRAYHRAKWSNRNSLLYDNNTNVKDSNTVRFMTNYNSQAEHIQTSLMKSWPILMADSKIAKILPERPQITFRRA
ncbi:unnamed protein product [Ranitomeya imitator]|uniref:Uncharacterized protein n=1 Tax=Ranitomeya imitator TaxID=111125 RepID=A0ABN9LRV9_9NEOB|nr:unnamed protein product [Ranitomeya imitator]